MLRNAARAALLDGRLCSETMYPAKADKTTMPQVTTAAACSGERRNVAAARVSTAQTSKIAMTKISTVLRFMLKLKVA